MVSLTSANLRPAVPTLATRKSEIPQRGCRILRSSYLWVSRRTKVRRALTAGKMTGDTKMQAEGKADKAKGAARKVAGDVKDAVRDATDND